VHRVQYEFIKASLYQQVVGFYEEINECLNRFCLHVTYTTLLIKCHV